MTDMEATNMFFDDFKKTTLVPYMGTLLRLWKSGEIVVALYPLPQKDSIEMAKRMGWDGNVPVFALSKSYHKALLEADHVTRKWLTTKKQDVHRIFLISGESTLLLNFSQKGGWWVEKGSTDGEMSSWGN